jgi:hypothetical protein
MMTKLGMACRTFMVPILVSVGVVASTVNAEETIRGETKRKDVTKEVQGAIQTASPKVKKRKASGTSWQKLSDKQIAQLLFPKEKLYFQPALEGPAMLDPEPFDGVAVYEIKRVVANFDNDPEDEMAILIPGTSSGIVRKKNTSY